MTVGGLAKKAKRISQHAKQAPAVKQQPVEEKKNFLDKIKQKFSGFSK
jgi:hypothetical protein